MLPISVEFAIGSATGLLDCILFHWIDTLKVRRQDGRPLLMEVATGKPLAQKTPVTIVRSLYAGFSTNVSLKVPYMASMFAFNAVNSRVLSHLGGDQTARDFAAAGLVGVEVSMMLAPLEMVRIQGQNCGKGGLLSASRAVAATAAGGLGGLWLAWTRGMTATMHRESKYCLGQFFLCGKIAELLAAHDAPSPPDGSALPGDATAPPPPTLRAQVAGAVLGGIACTAISHPDDVAKTRMQTHLRGSPLYATYATFSGSITHVARSEGLSALYRGAVFRCLLRVPLGLSVIIVSGTWMRQWAERRLGSSAS